MYYKINIFSKANMGSNGIYLLKTEEQKKMLDDFSNQCADNAHENSNLKVPNKSPKQIILHRFILPVNYYIHTLIFTLHFRFFVKKSKGKNLKKMNKISLKS